MNNSTFLLFLVLYQACYSSNAEGTPTCLRPTEENCLARRSSHRILRRTAITLNLTETRCLAENFLSRYQILSYRNGSHPSPRQILYLQCDAASSCLPRLNFRRSITWYSGVDRMIYLDDEFMQKDLCSTRDGDLRSTWMVLFFLSGHSRWRWVLSIADGLFLAVNAEVEM